MQKVMENLCEQTLDYLTCNKMQSNKKIQFKISSATFDDIFNCTQNTRKTIDDNNYVACSFYKNLLKTIQYFDHGSA